MASTLYYAPLAKFGPQTLYVFIENEVISSWAISKRSTNTELETNISRNLDFQLYHTYRHTTCEQSVVRKKQKDCHYQQKFGNRMVEKTGFAVNGRFMHRRSHI